jgi:squalene-hopene/tetraprenyl-beta-curcumene cyclase
MLLWAESYGLELLTADQRKHCVHQLQLLQKADGGWASATLGDWKRSDDKQQDLDTSDGYATGCAILVLRKSGLSSDDPRIQRGLQWLKANQRESGRWFTRSLNKDNKHFLSHAGTAFAVLALSACDEK